MRYFSYIEGILYMKSDSCLTDRTRGCSRRSSPLQPLLLDMRRPASSSVMPIISWINLQTVIISDSTRCDSNDSILRLCSRSPYVQFFSPEIILVNLRWTDSTDSLNGLHFTTTVRRLYARSMWEPWPHICEINAIEMQDSSTTESGDRGHATKRLPTSSSYRSFMILICTISTTYNSHILSDVLFKV